MKRGIYTLANDKVYDQLVAFLNSIETNYSPNIPVCVIPFNDELELVKAELGKRENTFLFTDQNSIQKWEKFITSFDKLYFDYPYEGVKNKMVNVVTQHRKYCAFDGEFEQFLFLDLDTLVFQPLDYVFDKLEQYDFVVHDFQRKTSIRLGEVNYYAEVFGDICSSIEELANRFHCSGFWASKKEMINEQDLDYFLSELFKGDIKIFRSWLSEQTKLNYMTMKKQLKLYNFTLDENSPYNTGSNITSSHFQERDHILYDHDKKLTYLHYMGVKNERLAKLCQWYKWHIPNHPLLMKLADKILKWQIADIPYKDIFLYYRFLPKR